MKVMLRKGLKIGDVVHKEATLREVTAGDVIDASEESEKLLNTPEGYELVSSPTLVGVNVLRRQVVSVGEHPGPLTLAEIRSLSDLDLAALQDAAEKLEQAALGIAKRGRPGGQGGNPGRAKH